MLSKLHSQSSCCEVFSTVGTQYGLQARLKGGACLFGVLPTHLAQVVLAAALKELKL